MDRETVEIIHYGIVDWVNSENGGINSSVRKGDVFCRWILENVFELSSSEALDATEVSGSFDHSIDAFAVHQNESLLILQTKFENSHSWDGVTKFHYDMKRILDNRVKDKDANDEALRIITKIQDTLEEARNNVEFYYVTSAKFTDVERSKRLSLDGIDDQFFIWDINDIADKLTKRQQVIPDTIRNRVFSLRLATREILKFGQDTSTAVIAVSLNDLHDFVEQGENDLFASNVRQYLKRTKINNGIRETIEKQPEKFWLYNNGITIVCDDFQEVEFSLEIKTPQIVNGCQTAKSIWEILSKKRESQRQNLSGHVLVKLIMGSDEEEKQKITRYTNSQNAVRGKDFFSLEEFHRKLNSKFKRIGYFYEIQRGAFASLKASDKEKYKGIPELQYLAPQNFKNLIPASEAVQSYAAGFEQIPAIAYGYPYQLNPGGKRHDDIFTDSLQPIPEIFLYPYLVRVWTKKYGYSQGGKGGWRAYSSIFFIYVYFLVALELFRQHEIIDSLETDPKNVNVNDWNLLFMESVLNSKLLEFTDGVLESYFIDSKVREAVDVDVRKFLKSHDTLNKYMPIVSDLIEIKIRNRQDISTEFWKLFSS